MLKMAMDSGRVSTSLARLSRSMVQAPAAERKICIKAIEKVIPRILITATISRLGGGWRIAKVMLRGSLENSQRRRTTRATMVGGMAIIGTREAQQRSMPKYLKAVDCSLVECPTIAMNLLPLCSRIM
jgi:hypothetical protein